MKKVLIGLCLTTIMSGAFADEWTGQDKTKHLIAGATIGSSVTLLTKNENYGLIAGCGAGVMKEYYDSKHRNVHTPSFKDFAVTCAGAYVGSKGSGWILRANGISYTRSF